MSKDATGRPTRPLVGLVLLAILYVTISLCYGPYYRWMAAKERYRRSPRDFVLSIATAALALAALLALTIGSNALVGQWTPLIPPTKLTAYEGLAAIALVLAVFPLFLAAEFSFGYLVGAYMYGMVAGFVVLSYSSPLSYDHDQARLSAIASLAAFLVPALFWQPRLPRSLDLPPKVMQALLIGLIILAVVLLVCNAAYGFRFAGFYESIAMRSEIARPAKLDYLTANCIGAALPFAVAFFASRQRWVLSTIAALAIPAFFPMLLNKTVLAAPLWLPFLFLLFSHFPPKTATVLSLALPILTGCCLHLLTPSIGFHVFGLINFRMVAIPSSAMDHYYAFFSTHPTTAFCQINAVKLFVACPYADQLGVVMANEYHKGNFNASMFATEGIASLGPAFAPLGTFLCGTIIAFGNIASSRLSPMVVAVSSGLVVQGLMNVPLSAMILTYGYGLLLLLWLLAPRAEQSPSS